MRKSAKWGLGIIIFSVMLIIFISILPESEEQKATEQQEKESLAEIEQKIKAISDNETVGEFISISKIEDDGLMYRIWINLLFEPENYQQVQTWTDAVCESSKRILDDGDITRNISVWAQRSAEKDEVKVYGRTFYDHRLDRSEFKNAEELKL